MQKLTFIILILTSFGCSSNSQTTGNENTADDQNKSLNQPIQNSDKLMNIDKFWGIIQNSKLKSSGDYEKQQSELKKELLKLNATEILEFDNQFRTLRGTVYNWNFWAAAYIINGGCSDDCFSDFRGWLIGQGKNVFENARREIETISELANTNEGDWEGIGYVANEAYKVKTGKDLPTGIRENIEITGEEWSEEGDDLKNRFPKLWTKYVTD